MVIVAASIPILVPLFRWIRVKLSFYNRSVESLSDDLVHNNEPESHGRGLHFEQRDWKRNVDAQREEYMLPTYPHPAAKDSRIVVDHEVTISHDLV